MASHADLVFRKQLVKLDSRKTSDLSDSDILGLVLSGAPSVEAAFKPLVLPLLDRAEQCEEGAAAALLTDYCVSLAAADDFPRAAALLSAAADNLEDTWVRPAQVRAAAEEAVRKAGPSADPKAMRELVEALNARMKQGDEKVFCLLSTRIMKSKCCFVCLVF